MIIHMHKTISEQGSFSSQLQVVSYKWQHAYKEHQLA